MYDKIRADYVTCSSRLLDRLRRQHLEVSWRSAINNILKVKLRAVFFMKTSVSSIRYSVSEKMCRFKDEGALFSFVVPFTLTTVQGTNLALTQTKRLTVYSTLQDVSSHTG
jgi:hypothetical protein